MAKRQISKRLLPVIEFAHPKANELGLCDLFLRVNRVLNIVVQDALSAVEVCVRPKMLSKRSSLINLRQKPAYYNFIA